MVLWRPTRPFRTNTQKRCLFHYRGLEYQSRKWRIPGVTVNLALGTEWSRAKANRVLPTECTGHSKHPLPTIQEKTLHMVITRWSILKSDYILCSQRWRSSIQSPKTWPGADCGSDHELLIAKLILKLKKVGETTRPFRYDLNQTPYNYTVEMRNRFKGLDLIDRVPEELWKEVHDIVQEAVIKTFPMKKKCKGQNGCLKRPYK